MKYEIGQEVLVTFPKAPRRIDHGIGMPTPGDYEGFDPDVPHRAKVVGDWPWNGAVNFDHPGPLDLLEVKFVDHDVWWNCHPDWVEPLGGPW